MSKPTMTAMDTSSLTGLIEFLAYEAKTGDMDRRNVAWNVLNALVNNLDGSQVTADETLTIQGLAVSYCNTIMEAPEDPAMVRYLVGQVRNIILASSVLTEQVTGAKIGDRLFFEKSEPTVVVQ